MKRWLDFLSASIKEIIFDHLAPDLVLLIEGPKFGLESWVYFWCIQCHDDIGSGHDIGCTGDNCNF